MGTPEINYIALRRNATRLPVHHQKRTSRGSVLGTDTVQTKHTVGTEAMRSIEKSAGPVMRATLDTLPRQTMVDHVGHH